MARPAPRVSLPQQQIAAPAVVPPSFEVTGAWPVVPDAAPSSTGLRGELAALERQRILDALERSAWNQTKAARLLGMPRGQLMARLNQYGIARPRKKTEP